MSVRQIEVLTKNNLELGQAQAKTKSLLEESLSREARLLHQTNSLSAAL